MKGSFFLGNGRFEVREKEIPALGPRDVLIRNMAAGVCGTDVHIYHGEEGSAAVTPPVVLGHEYAGLVEAVGGEVTAVSVGDHVTVDPNMYCGQCPNCRAGKKQLCERMVAVGVNFDGGFAEYSVVPEGQCFRLAPDLPYEVGAMAEPIACCLHGIDLAQIRPGQRVLVIGGGAIGLIMAQLARLSGAASVIVSEPIEMRRQIALQVGADGVIDPMREDVRGRFQELTGRDGAEVVIECVGRPVAVKQAVEAAAPGAMLMLFSVPSVGATYELPLFDIFKKELTIRGSMVNPDTHARAVALLNAGRLQIEPLITHRFPLGDVEDAIKMQMSAESIKVLVKPWGDL